MGNFKLKNLYHLLGYNFHIPSFQRGYRWEKKQIEDLLEDLKEFSQSDKVARFYCLQPIVVQRHSKGENTYDILDGQQRLTTLYLILSYLGIEELFKLQFDTRKEGDFLNKKRFEEADSDLYRSNIDFFYIQKSYDVVKRWFCRDDGNKKVLRDLLTISPVEGVRDDDLRDVRVLWYEINRGEDETNNGEDVYEVFSNLNFGKIGLTETELIKAIILQCDVYGKEKPYMSQWSFKVASDWDLIERELQEPTFMAMLASDIQIKECENTLVSRIFFVLDLVAKYYLSEAVIDGNKKCYKYKYEKNCLEQEEKKTSLNNPRYVYSVINQYLSGDGVVGLSTFKDRVATLWEYILDTFSVLKDWYRDHVIYHELGLLRLLDNNNDNLLFDLFANYTQNGKDEFRLDIKKRIGDKVRITSKYTVNGIDQLNTLQTINYHDNSDEIRNILKLFNVQLMIDSHQDGVRFDFAKFREQNVTSLEHIYPQSLGESSNIKYNDLKEWIKRKEEELKELGSYDNDMKDSFDILNDLDEYKFHDDLNNWIPYVQQIEKKCDDLLEMDEVIKHSIKNLALIDKNTNSALGNELMDDKRNKLKMRSKELGVYVPIGTWHVFNKFFSQNVSNLKYWTAHDRDAYYAVIEKIYNEYAN